MRINFDSTVGQNENIRAKFTSATQPSRLGLVLSLGLTRTFAGPAVVYLDETECYDRHYRAVTSPKDLDDREHNAEQYRQAVVEIQKHKKSRFIDLEKVDITDLVYSGL